MNHQITTLNPQTLELLKGSFQLLQLEEFFDVSPSESRSSRKLWTSPKKHHLANLQEKTIFETTMYKKSKVFGQWKSRYYILTQDFLAYKEKHSSVKVKAIMLFDRVKLECIDQSQKDKIARFGFCFHKNKIRSKLYVEDQQIYEKLKTYLNHQCILNTFQDDFQIEKLIGSGSFGKVYLVTRNSDKQKFAAKMFFKDSLLKQNKGREGLLMEIRILQRLNHPGIMKLYEVHESLLSIFLIMELLEGGEFLQFLQEKKVYSESDCATILKNMMEPLAYMHSKGIMHRDIKPENLILRDSRKEFDLVIADFGLAQDFGQKIVHYKCGTPGYCAPEVLAAKGNNNSNKLEYGVKCDVFSVGCIFYYIITGQGPFFAKQRKEVQEKNKQCIIITDEPRLNLLSSAARDLLFQMLCKDPELRPSFEECLNHEFFKTQKKNSIPSFAISPQLGPLKFEHKEKDKNNKEEIEAIETPNSLVFGRPNLILGRIKTFEEDLPVDKITNKMGDSKMTQAEETKHTLLTPLNSKRLGSNLKLSDAPKGISENIPSESMRESDSKDEGLDVVISGATHEMSGKLMRLRTDGVMKNPFG